MIVIEKGRYAPFYFKDEVVILKRLAVLAKN